MATQRRVIGVRCFGAALFGCLSLIGATGALAGEIHVYAGQSIQDAIDIASGGDEVIVHPGTYPELIDFLGKAITLRGSDGPNATIIDGTGLYASVVKCAGGESYDSVLQGFTITGGKSEYGGGMHIYQSSATVSNCVFTANQSYEAGGGLAVRYGGVALDGCSFIANTTGCIGGGGMYTYESDATFNNCAFTANQAQESGGGLSVRYGSATITGCSFTGNSSDYEAGGLLAGSYSRVDMSYCLFRDNTASGDQGGGAYVSGYNVQESTIVSCVFVDNTAEDCGGLRIINAIMTNCTVAGNIADSGTGGASAYDACTLTNCIFWANIAGVQTDDLSAPAGVATYCNMGASSFGYHCGGEGNTCTDPNFVEPLEGDYRLGPGSPCADAGSDAAVPPGVVTDFDGNPRFVDADADGNAAVDMGAYEFQETCYGVQLAVPGEYATIQEAIDAACFNDEIVVAPGAYPESINLRGKAITLRSSGGPEVTTVDAQGLDAPAVLCISSEGPETVIEGLTITGGSGMPDGQGSTAGGGMYIYHSSPTVGNCRFVSNAVTGPSSLGGGVFLWGGTPQFSGCVFNDNSAGDGAAAAAKSLWHYNCSYPNQLVFSDCVFSANNAYYEGAIWVGSRCSLSLSGGTISANHAGHDGGAVVLDYDASASISDCVFTGNTADGGGGAVFAWGDSLVIAGCEFNSNEASVGGGAVFAWGNSLVITGCEFNSNEASVGGAVSSQGDDVRIEQTSFAGNTAVYSGGAVIIEQGELELAECDFNSNQAFYGGAVCSTADGGSYLLTLTDCTFTANDAGYGGGAYCHEFGWVTITTSNFVANTAFEGGGLRVFAAFVDVTDCLFAENVVTEVGGGISNLEGFLTVADTLFCENQPDHVHGPHVDGGGNEFLDECPGDCPADVNDDDVVDIDDLFAVFAAWGLCDECPEDINEDGVVDIDDIFAVLADWGPCP